MANNYFQFKKFTVWHDKCAMKVGTDGVLLGSWVSLDGCNSILDVGTGTGLVALMLAQRSSARIDAIDIDADACAQAEINVKKSPFADQIDIIHKSLSEYIEVSSGKYDLIVSNPPYFINSVRSIDEKRTLARHSDSLSLSDLFADSKRLLTDEGRFALIYPSLHELEILKLASLYQLELLKKTYVKPTHEANPKRILLEFSKKRVEAFTVETIVIEEKRHQYTPEYIELTKDFYLKM